jgi:hypothetical protein
VSIFAIVASIAARLFGPGFLDGLPLYQSAPVNAVDCGHDQTDDRKQRGHQLD